MVPTSFVHFPKCRRHVLAGYLVWLAIQHTCYTPESTFELLHTLFTAMQNVQCHPEHDIPHQEGLVSKGWCFVPEVQNFI